MSGHAILWDAFHMTNETSPIDQFASPIAQRVYDRMVALKLNQKSLAEKAGLNLTYVRDLYKGRSKNPKMTELYRLASALECDVTDLTGKGGAGSLNGLSEENYTPEEIGLIEMWRVLGKVGRDRVLETIEGLIPTVLRRDRK